MSNYVYNLQTSAESLILYLVDKHDNYPAQNLPYFENIRCKIFYGNIYQVKIHTNKLFLCKKHFRYWIYKQQNLIKKKGQIRLNLKSPSLRSHRHISKGFPTPFKNKTSFFPLLYFSPLYRPSGSPDLPDHRHSARISAHLNRNVRFIEFFPVVTLTFSRYFFFSPAGFDCFRDTAPGLGILPSVLYTSLFKRSLRCFKRPESYAQPFVGFGVSRIPCYI